MTRLEHKDFLPGFIQLRTKQNIIPGATVNTRFGSFYACAASPQRCIHNPRTLWAISHTAVEDDLHSE